MIIISIRVQPCSFSLHVASVLHLWIEVILYISLCNLCRLDGPRRMKTWLWKISHRNVHQSWWFPLRQSLSLGWLSPVQLTLELSMEINQWPLCREVRSLIDTISRTNTVLQWIFPFLPSSLPPHQERLAVTVRFSSYNLWTVGMMHGLAILGTSHHVPNF